MSKMKFLKSFAYAYRGIMNSIKSEINMRIHIVVMLYVLYFSGFYNMTAKDYAVLFVLFGLVISLELVNTSVEHTVDKASPEKSELARLAKDAAAGAVLVSAIFAVIIGFLMFWNIEVFREIFSFFCEKLSRILFLISSLLISFIFIVLIGKERKGYKK